MAITDAQSGATLLSVSAPAPIRLGGTVTKGDAVGYAGGWIRALATVGSVTDFRCVAGEDGVLGQTIIAYFDAVILSGRITAATEGAAVYVAEGSNNGQYTETAPSTTGDINTIIGYAITATKLALQPSLNPDTIA